LVAERPRFEQSTAEVRQAENLRGVILRPIARALAPHVLDRKLRRDSPVEELLRRHQRLDVIDTERPERIAIDEAVVASLRPIQRLDERLRVGEELRRVLDPVSFGWCNDPRSTKYLI